MGTGYLRRQANHGFGNTSRAVQDGGKLAQMSPRELGWHIEAVVSKIHAGHYTHYSKGGYSRASKAILSAAQVAYRCGVMSDKCLLEIKDPRVEQAVQEMGLIVVTPATHRPKSPKQPEVRVWRQSIVY